MLDDLAFFLAAMAIITGFITPLWFAGLYCIMRWNGDLRRSGDDVSDPQNSPDGSPGNPC